MLKEFTVLFFWSVTVFISVNAESIDTICCVLILNLILKANTELRLLHVMPVLSQKMKRQYGRFRGFQRGKRGDPKAQGAK